MLDMYNNSCYSILSRHTTRKLQPMFGIILPGERSSNILPRTHPVSVGLASKYC